MILTLTPNAPEYRKSYLPNSKLCSFSQLTFSWSVQSCGPLYHESCPSLSWIVVFPPPVFFNSLALSVPFFFTIDLMSAHFFVLQRWHRKRYLYPPLQIQSGQLWPTPSFCFPTLSYCLACQTIIFFGWWSHRPSPPTPVWRSICFVYRRCPPFFTNQFLSTVFGSKTSRAFLR